MSHAAKGRGFTKFIIRSDANVTIFASYCSFFINYSALDTVDDDKEIIQLKIKSQVLSVTLKKLKGLRFLMRVD